MKTLLEFDYEKAVQALNYLATKEGGKINKMKAIKLLWLADRYHLRKYGRPIFNDYYYAMKRGPVGSSIKDITEFSVLSDEEAAYASQFIRPDEKRLHYESLREPDLDVLSESDMEAMNIVVGSLGKRDQFGLADFSHDFPEWKRFKVEIESGTARMPMTYIDFFKNPEIKKSGHEIFDESDDQLEKAKEIFNNNFQTASFWTG